MGRGVAYAQNYNFSHYGVEDGLIQSQTTNFSEDRSHRLWISTLGGACRFDGKEYYKVTKEQGLVNNFVYCIHADRTGKIWFGTLEGLCYLQGGKFFGFKSPLGTQRPLVTSIAEDNNGVIWVIVNNHLFKIAGRDLEPVRISGGAKELVSYVTTNGLGQIFVSVYQKGIYSLQGSAWADAW